MTTTDKRRAYDERLRAELAADPKHRAHGTANGYRARCRCPRCTREQALRLQAYRRSLKP